MLNKVIIMGRLTADPELKQTPSGVAVCKFSVAVDRGFKAKDTGERQADFIRVTAWRASAEFVSKYFSKGRMIIVEGALRNNDYEDSNGVKHYSMDVQAEKVQFGETKGASSTNAGNVPAAQTTQSTTAQQTTQEPPVYATDPASNELGDLGDFEEILSDGEVPF